MCRNEKFKIFALIIFLIIAIIGCGGDDDDDGSDETQESQTITGRTGEQVNLDGPWEKACAENSTTGDSVKSDLTISGSSIIINEDIWFGRVGCNLTPDITLSYGARLIKDKEITARLEEIVVTATVVNIDINTAVGEIKNPAFTPIANARDLCGLNNWQTSVIQSIRNTTCLPLTSFSEKYHIDDTLLPHRLYIERFRAEDEPEDYVTVGDQTFFLRRNARF